MIIKVCYGEGQHVSKRILACDDMRIEEKEDYHEIIVHHKQETAKDEHYTVLNLGHRNTVDHLYIMDDGKTVDHMTFYPVEKKEIKSIRKEDLPITKTFSVQPIRKSSDKIPVIEFRFTQPHKIRRGYWAGHMFSGGNKEHIRNRERIKRRMFSKLESLQFPEF